MTERRALIDGIKPKVDPARELAFVHGEQAVVKEAVPVTNVLPPTANSNRSPISTRIRSDLANALKRASLERQLNNQDTNTLQDILEQAIEIWLKNNGYRS
jgi:hypothetical protein